MSKKIKILLGIMVIILIFFAVSDGNKRSESLKIGVISGTVGDYGFVGQNFNRGVLLAQKEWLARHPGTQIEIVVEEDEFDGKKGLSAYQKLVSIDKINALINVSTFTLDNIYDLVSKTDMPVAQGFIQTQEEKDDNIFQLWPGTIPGERELGEEIKKRGFKNVVVFVDQGSAGYQKFANAFKEGYGSEVKEIRVPTDNNGLKAIALKAVSEKPDALVFIVDPKTGGLLLKEVEVISKEKIQYVFDSNIVGGFENYRSVLNDTSVLNGSIIFTIPSEFSAEFKKKYFAEYNQEPGLGSDMGYDAFMLLMETYDKDNTEWIENMRKFTFDGAGGEIIFDEVGVRMPRIKIGTIENGKIPE